MTHAIALAVFVTAALPASSQDRDAPARKAGNGVLRGRVVAADTGRPVAHATITAASAKTGSRPTPPTSTDVSEGRMLFEGPVSPPRAETGFRVSVESGAPGAAIVGRRSEDDTFVLSGIEAGTRRLTTTAPAEWILKAIYLHGQDVSELPIEFRDGMTQENVTVVFTTVTSPLSIAVEHASPEASATVAVFPRDPATWHAASRRIQFRAAGAEAITVDTLPPGDYLVAAIADVAARSLRPGDVKLLERLSPFAEHVRLVEGTTTSVRVRPVAMAR